MAQQHDIDQYNAEVVAMAQRCLDGTKKELAQYEYPCIVVLAIRQKWHVKYERGLAILRLIYGVEDDA